MWKHSLAHFYFLLFLKFISCCQCNINQTTEKDLYIEKRQLEFEDYTTEMTDNATESTVSVDRPTVTSYHLGNLESNNETSTESYEGTTPETTEATERKQNSTDIKEHSEYNESTENILDPTEGSIDLNEFITPDNETTTEIVRKRVKTLKHSLKDQAKKCRHYRKGNSFDLSKMADVWQVVYYQLPNKLKCFKIHIKLVKLKEQQRYATVFGNFNDTVRWDKCFLEIKSSEKSEGGSRRHFLQGTQSDRGVMENIIIDEEHCENTTYITLHRESGDQWSVIKNLLVMRDCETGDLVVFTKVPSRPRRDDILDALTVFGESKLNGTMACEEKSEKTWIKYEDDAPSTRGTKKK
ncbi:hypothetical protein B5X24_HaOG207895 [Helicoverpa armigera]|uniref:Uncharacterized protein n=1 Tax=Helicoverpa armigera TaxID=29058 RepID=A0A2W1BHU1_HELAM|nr:uncharacterized protein LOC110379668 isoform X2 [Helicoverpa armigera]PZC74418.1 hypothetical protein B5X24_HaOG207895 [Helicoverpa armigera]